MKFALLFCLSLVVVEQAGSADFFKPEHLVSGIGVERDDMSSVVLAARTDRMIQSQTFAILRDPQALAGARRIAGSAKLQALFKVASQRSGWPPELIEAISYLESWGDPKAESPSGPRGIMQISAATARTMGLKVIVSTRYKVTKTKVPLAGAPGKSKTVTHKVPYTVTVRDDRLLPDRAIPAAAIYLASLERKFGGRDWAVFAYHCGAGCVAEMLELTRQARGIPKDQLTVARMFFSCSPAWNRELYQAIEQQMQRDYSPTYYFRILRAEQLLAIYRANPAEFEGLFKQYKSDFTAATSRAPHRLSVWLKRDDLVFHSDDDIRIDPGKRLVRALDRPDFFGYKLDITPDIPADLEFYSQASPAAVGTLMTIAFETRRLHEALGAKGEKFMPLPVSSLVESEAEANKMGQHEALAHATGQVFDIDYAGLPPGELECLRFVLDDLGWDGYLGFIDEGRDSLHIGCSPSSRDFFASVFQDAVGKH